MKLPVDRRPPPGDCNSLPEVASSRKAFVGVGFVLLSALAFGSTPAFVRLAYSAQVNAMSLVAFRCLIAAAVLWVASRLMKEMAIAWFDVLRLIAVGGLLFGPQMWLYFAALHRLDTSVTVAVVYAYPAIVAILVAIRLRRFPRVAEMVLLALALCGVVTIAALNGAAHTSQIGMVLAGSTAVGYAVYVLAADAVVRALPPLAAASWVLLGAGSSTTIVALMTHRMELPKTESGWLFVALHGLVIVPIGLAAYYAGLKRLGATRTSIVDTSQPAIAVIIGVSALGERLDGVQVLGIVCIVIAVLGLPVVAAVHARRKQSEGRGLQRVG